MTDSTNNAPAADPTSPIAPAGNGSALRVHYDPDGAPVVEHLRTEGSESQTNRSDADVDPPQAAHFVAELEQHATEIQALEARLVQQNFDSRTGQPKGYALQGEDRRRAELQLKSRQDARDFTVACLAAAHARAEARAEQRAKAVEQGQPDPEATNLVEAARREALIAETAADLDSNGKPLGRVRATQLVDEELHRARVAARVARR